MLKLSLTLCLSDSCALSCLVPAHPQKGVILHEEGPLKIDKPAITPALSPKEIDVPTRADSILNALVTAAFCSFELKGNRQRMKSLYIVIEAMTYLDMNLSSTSSDSDLDDSISLKAF